MTATSATFTIKPPKIGEKVKINKMEFVVVFVRPNHRGVWEVTLHEVPKK